MTISRINYGLTPENLKRRDDRPYQFTQCTTRINYDLKPELLRGKEGPSQLRKGQAKGDTIGNCMRLQNVLRKFVCCWTTK
jgi:hypothetical protein